MDTTQPVSGKDSRGSYHISTPIAVAMVTGIFLLLTIGFWTQMGEEAFGREFPRFYGPAVQAVLHGESPYAGNPTAEYPFATPPWVIPFALPFSFLPDKWARAAWMATGILGYGFVLYRMKAPPLGAALFLLSPMVVFSIILGQIEWLILLGLVMPPPIGLILLMLKPQMGALLALYWVIEAWCEGTIMSAVRLVAPFGGILLLSFVLYGFWPLEMTRLVGGEYTSPLWPYGVPLALVAFITAIRRREEGWAGAAGPFIAPYAAFHSWSISAIWLVSDPVSMGIVTLSLWALAVINPLLR